MQLIGLMPTYGNRERLVNNCLACFESQTIPYAACLVYNDMKKYTQWARVSGDLITIGECAGSRRPSLPHKYDSMVKISTKIYFPDADAFVVMDDDDVYLPNHFAAHAEALKNHGWSYPSHVFQQHQGFSRIDTAGRFHGSLAIRRDMWERYGGWVGLIGAENVLKTTFDQRMIAALSKIEPPGRPEGITYCYRWESTKSEHVSGRMFHENDDSWYTKPNLSDEPEIEIKPQFDEDTLAIMKLAAEFKA